MSRRGSLGKEGNVPGSPADIAEARREIVAAADERAWTCSGGRPPKGIRMDPQSYSHPGESIADVIEERGLKQREFAALLAVGRRLDENPEAFDVAVRRRAKWEIRLSRVLAGKNPITLDLAFALESAGVATADFWMTRQAHYDVAVERVKRKKKKKKKGRAGAE